MLFSTSTLLVAFVAVANLARAAPLPGVLTVRDGGSAYSGIGGSAKGGDTYTTPGGLEALDVASKNGGDGGNAGSGDAEGGHGGVALQYYPDGSKVVHVSGGGSAYSGAAGNADGGSSNVTPPAPVYNGYGYTAYDSPDLLDSASIANVGSSSGGDGGYAKSGDVQGGDAGNALAAYGGGAYPYGGPSRGGYYY